MKNTKSFGRLAFALHSWLGLITGVFLLLLGLSGSALVFLKEIDQVLNAELLRVQPKEKRLSLDQMYRQIGKDHPNIVGMAWLNPNAAKDEAYEFRLYQNDGKISSYDLGLISMDPYTGKILREGNLKDLSTGFMHWLVQFHWSFQLGLPGLLLATVFGLSMLLSIITGLVIYRKYVWKVLLFRVKFKWNNWRSISSGLHRIVGVWTIVFNLIIFFTGFWMNMFSMDPGYWKSQTISPPANTLSTRSMDDLLRIAKASMPELILKNVYLPTQPGKTFRIRGSVPGQSAIFEGTNAIILNQFTGAVISTSRLTDKSFSEKLEASFFSLHVGNFGGWPIKMLYVIIGLMPGLLSITGALLWWRKRA